MAEDGADPEPLGFFIMSEQLPYFRFYASGYLDGDITLENEKTQGLFIQICAWYWKKDCHINLEFINKRLIKGIASLEKCLQSLIESDILKVDDNQLVRINFLNEQYDLLSGERLKKVKSGRLGGLQKSSNAKATPEQTPSYKEVEEEVEKEKNCGNTADYEIFVKKWFKFFEHKTGNKPSFNGVDGKSIKSIIAKLQKLIKDNNSDEKPIELFHAILTKWDSLENWHQENCLELKVFNQKFDTIFAKLKTVTNGQVELLAEIIAKHSR